MSRSRTLAVLFALVAATGLVGAWLPVGHAEVDAQPSPHSLEIRGSGAMGGLARAMAEKYMADHAETVVTVQTCGATQALKSLIIGTSGLAMGTDEVPEELSKLAADLKVELKRTDVYRDALVVVVHPSNPVRDLSLKQVRDIFRGTVTRWSEVGGPDAEIEVFSLQATSATYEVFKRQVLGADAVMTPKATLVTGKQLREGGIKPLAVGYVGLSQWVRLNKPGAAKAEREKKERLEEGITVDCTSPPPGADAAADPNAQALIFQGVSIGGVCPSTRSVMDGTYPIVRRMSLYQRVDGPRPLTDAVVGYFMDETKGQLHVAKDGNVPMKAVKR